MSQLYTIERYGSKGWEIVEEHEGLHTAIAEYRKCLMQDNAAYRLTSPEAR